jgi:hypothetical protein
MNTYVKPTENFEDAMRSRGFELYGIGGVNANWIAKIADGHYLTITCDGCYTVYEWQLCDGYTMTDDEFVESLVGVDVSDLDNLFYIFNTRTMNVLELFFNGVYAY